MLHPSSESQINTRLAEKSNGRRGGVIQGIDVDDRFSDNDRPTEFFGEQLKAAGYNYHGNEPMYSGITGEEFHADIYIGLVYYQRLRHMVNDKFQVRTTGPVDPLTRQPVKVSRDFLH